MELLQQFCIFVLMVNFVAGSEETDSDESDQCYQQYENRSLCHTFLPRFDNLSQEINATSKTYSGTEDDKKALRSLFSRYCVPGQVYLECMEKAPMAVECQETPGQGPNDIFAEKIVKFAIEYFCRNEAEVLLKIAANNGLDFIVNEKTGETLERCFNLAGREENSISRRFCSNVGTISSCLLEYSDTMPNTDISGTIRDIIPKLKEIAECTA